MQACFNLDGPSLARARKPLFSQGNGNTFLPRLGGAKSGKGNFPRLGGAKSGKKGNFPRLGGAKSGKGNFPRLGGAKSGKGFKSECLACP